MQFSWKNPLKALPVLLLLGAYAGAAFGVAGNVQFVIGDVKLINPAGETRALQKGAAINEGDRIVTAAGASAQIKMVDGGFIAVRPNTEMGFDTYRYSGKEDGSESAIVSLLRGGFRTITGIIGRANKQNYMVKTSTATIGIRGTDHEPMVILPPAVGQVAIAEPGTYDKVNVGVAFIRTDAGSVDIQRNQVGFAPVTKAAPMILPRIPSFYKQTPAPGAQKGKEESKDEAKKDNGQVAAAGSETADQEKKAAAPEEKTAAAPAEKAPEATTEIRDTAIVDPTTSVAAAPATAPVASAPTEAAPVVKVTMEDTSGSSLNATDQTLISPTGTVVPISEGVYATQAQSVADQALASYKAAQTALATINTAQTDASAKASAAAALTAVSLAPATSAISAAQPAITSAQAAADSAKALVLADATTATANATAAASLAASTASLASTASSAYSANGAFADSTAVAAKALMDSANAQLQTANANLQSAASELGAQSAVFASAQSAAATAFSSAGTLLSDANTAVSNATTQNAALATAQSATSSAAGSIPTYVSAAQAAASAAQAAAQAAQAAANQALSLQSAGDYTGAQAQLTIAQQQLAIAQQQQAAVATQLAGAQSAAATVSTQSTAAQTAATAAQTQVTSAVTAADSAAAAAASIATLADAAQTAKTLADAAVATIASELPAVQAAAPTIQQNAVLAQYSNPAVASSNFIGVFSSMKSVTGGVEHIMDGPSTPSQNTNYVLDGNKNLVEIRSVGYERSGMNYDSAIISNADIVFRGGTAKDQANDPNGTYYLGRWSGGQIDVKDLASTVAPFSDLLGPKSAHWLVGLLPGNLAANPSMNNVQQVVGTADYTLAAATHPTDSLGNVGTLNSASLSANFSAQTVNASLALSFSSADTVNVSTRNLSLSASANNVPINKDGFETKPGGPYAPAVSCSGADCAASGYVGGIGGGFLASASGGSSTGAVGTGVGMVYGFESVVAAPTAFQPYTDSIQGAAVLSTGTTPTAGTTAVAIAGGSGVYRQLAVAPQTVGTNTYHSFYTTPSGAAPNLFNYLFDSSGNLVRIYDSYYGLSDRGRTAPPSYSTGALPYTGTPGDVPSSPLVGTVASFFGGTAPDGNYNDTVNGIRMGRYAGGTIITTDMSGSMDPLNYYTELGSNSLNWVVRELPTGIPASGSFDYTPAYSTKPTDSLGNTGTLNYASLTANFTNNTVNPAVSVSINNQTLLGAATNVPIDSQFGFDTANGRGLIVSCYGTNCAPAPVGVNTSTTPYLSYVHSAYGGRIMGGLAGTGNTAGGAFFRYVLDTYYNPEAAAGEPGGIPSGATRPVNDYVDGQVAFTKGTGVAVPTTSNVVFRTAYLAPPTSTDPLQSWTSGYRVSPTDYTSSFGTGSPNTIGNPSGSGAWETLTGGTVAEVATEANSFAATGISFGRYEGGALTGSGIDVPPRTVDGTYAWIKGPSTPFQASAMTGSARYKFDGGTQTGTTFSGAVNNAVLAVDFNRQAVGLDLWVTGYGGSDWTATTNSGGYLSGSPPTTLRMSNGGGFYGSSWNATDSTLAALHQSLYVTKDSGAVNAPGISGQINGALMGKNLSGAGLAYSFQDTNSTLGGGPQGAVAFALDSYTHSPTLSNASGSVLPTPTTTTGTSAIDLANRSYVNRVSASGLIATPAAVDEQYLTRVARMTSSPGRLPLGADGLPTSWDGQRLITITPSCTGCAPFVAQVPQRTSIDPSSFVATGVTPANIYTQVELPSGLSPATVLEAGFDPATGMRWGRYGGGVIARFDRQIYGGFSPSTYDLTSQNLHTILGPTQAGAMNLPLTGTFTYTNVGGTHPTDNLGSPAGTLNAATLVANFGAQTVDAGVNLTVNGNTWSAGASAMPIQGGRVFGANRQYGSGNLNVCATGCNTTTTIPTASTSNTSGNLVGSFNGASGQGAGVAYSLNQGGLTGTTVSGVAAFRR